MSYAIIEHKYKRRVTKKTNYLKRLGLLKSGKPRLVIRLSNLYINIQYILHNPKGDISKVNILSKMLKNYGWNKSFKNTPAGYLIGYLFGKKVLKDKKLGKELIFDIGLQKSQKGGRLYAVIKGAVDAGLKIPVSEEVFPSKDRIEGKHLKYEKLFAEVKANIDKEFK